MSITEYFQDSEKQKAQGDFLRASQAMSPFGVIAVDSGHRIQYANLPAARMFGFHTVTAFRQRAEFVEDLLPDKRREQHKAYFDEWFENPRPLKLGVRHGTAFEGQRLTDGSRFPLAIQVVPYDTDRNGFHQRGDGGEVLAFAYLISLGEFGLERVRA